jgi:excisionase family DNA binding protein
MESPIANSIESPLFDLASAAQYLRAKISTMRWLIKTGQLAYLRVGRKFCVRKSELDAWISSHERREKPTRVGASLVLPLRKAR